jgi:RHS repeat-associated protein
MWYILALILLIIGVALFFGRRWFMRISGGPTTSTPTPITTPITTPGGNTPPEISQLTFQPNPPVDRVFFSYLLKDADTDPVQLEVQYSTNSGGAWQTASETPTGSDGTGNLSSSPNGESHVFGWDSPADLIVGVYSDVIVRFRPHDSQSGNWVSAGPFPLSVTNQRPSLTLFTPAGGQFPSPVDAEYELVDVNADPIDLDVAFSIDSGVSFLPATEFQTGSDGTRGLSSSPAGDRHVYKWNAWANVGTGGATGVILAFTPRDQASGLEVRSAPFDVLPQTAASPIPPPHPPVFPPPPVNPGPPEVRLHRPFPGLGPVTLVTTVKSEANEPVTMTLEYSKDSGASWATCSMHADSDLLSELPASSFWLDYNHIWDTRADLPANTQETVMVRVKITESSGASSGYAQTPQFQVDTTPEPPLPMNTDPVVTPLSILIEDGNLQTGLAGFPLKDPLKVKVLDNTGSPLPEARVHFAVVNPSSSMNAEIHDDPVVPATTGADGIAGARVTVSKGVQGTLAIRASIDGVPGMVANFSHTIARPRVVVDPQTVTASLGYGRTHQMTFYIEGDNDPGTVEYFAGEHQRRTLEVAVTNAHIDQHEMEIRRVQSGTGSPGIPGPWANRVSITPIVRTGTIAVRVYDPQDPFVVEYNGTITIDPPQPARRLASYRPRYYTNFPAWVEQVSGFDPSRNAEQRVYPGLTLNTPFQVKLTDGTQDFVQQVTGGVWGCVVPTLENIRVNWRARNGFVSKDRNTPGTDTHLTEDIQIPVYFTADDSGPMFLEATVSVYVADPSPRTFRWIDSSGNPQCYRENGIWVNEQFTFMIQPPEAIHFVNARYPHGIDEITKGTIARLRAEGLSPYVSASNAGAVEIETRKNGNATPYTWGGFPAVYKQNVSFHSHSNRSIETGDIRFLSGNPLPTPFVGTNHQMIPHCWLRCQVGSILRPFPYAGRKLNRKTAGPTRTVQETSVQSSATVGFEKVMHPASGEVIRISTDLTFQTRPDNFIFSRSYRSMLEQGGMFGPGWQSIFDSELQVSERWGFRLLDGYGRSYDFNGFDTPRGMFDRMYSTNGITPDQGLYYLMDPQRNEIHFNADGSLRLHKDRMDNYTRFDYNTTGYLIRITDPLNRVVQLDYYNANDPVPEELHGQVKTLTDFAGRVVDYTYYTDPSDPDGPVGYLKQVQWAKADTKIGNTVQADYRRSETYSYYKTTDTKHGCLKEIKDSTGTVLMSFEYDADRRVTKQSNAIGNWTLDYPAGAPVKYTDADNNIVTYSYKPTPHTGASAPFVILNKANRNVRPGMADIRRTLEYNHDGNVVVLTHPDGAVEDFVFETSSDARRRNNQLVHQYTSAQGESRTHSWVFSNRYNMPLSYVSPAGHVPGASRREWETVYTYDYMVNMGNFGNLVRVVKPRQMQGAVIKNNAGNDEQRWIHDNPSLEFNYNAKGLVTRAKDEQGIVTNYEYYPENTPAGGAGIGHGANGGGFLAQAIRDNEVSPDRDLYFPNQPLMPLTSKATYHNTGDIKTFQDHNGITNEYQVNGLRQLTKFTAGQSFTGSGSVESMEEEFLFSHQSMIVERKLKQPNAPALAGGSKLSTHSERDDLGRIVGEKADLGNGESAEISYGLNGNNVLTTMKTPNAMSGDSPDEQVEVEMDEINRPYKVRLGRSSAGSPGGSSAAHRTIEFEYDQSMVIKALHGPAAKTTAIKDSLGALVGASADNDLHTTHLVDKAGNVVGQLQENPGTVYGFSETKRRKDGALVRYTRGYLQTDPLNPGGPAFPVTDRKDGYPGILTRTPPASTSLLEDEGFLSPNDGKHLYDLLRDSQGRVVRVLQDTNHRTWFRWNPHGNLAKTGDGSREIEFGYRNNGQLEDVVLIEESTDPAAPLTLELKNKFERDGYGRPVRILDTVGNAITYEYQQKNHVVIMKDPNGPDSNEQFNGFAVNQPGNEVRLATDGANRVSTIEMTLTQDGMGGSAPEANQYNLNAKTSLGFHMNRGGSITGLADSSGAIIYGFAYDGKGRMRVVFHPRSRAAPGGARTVFTYDSKDRIETVTDPNGTRIKMTYDAKNRINQVKMEAAGANLHNNTATEFGMAYEKRDHMITAADSSWNPKIEFRYDSHENITDQSQPYGAIKSHWQGKGVRIALEYPRQTGVSGRHTLRYWPDWHQRIRHIMLNGSVLAHINYVGKKAIRTMTFGPLSMKISYDLGGRMEKVEYSGFSGGQKLTYDTKPNRLSRFKEWTRTYGTVVEKREWDRDSIGRIREETATFGGGRQPEAVKTRRWFDADSSIRKIDRDITRHGSTNRTETRFAREERGRIIQMDTTFFDYNPNGELTRDDQMDYSYDWMSRLTKVHHRASNQTSEFFYDQFGRRFKAIHDGSREERFIYDGWQLIEVRDNSNAVKEQYFYGPGTDQLIACNINGTFYYVTLAPDGSVDCLVKDNGDIAQTYDYDLFGRRTVLDAARAVTGGDALCRIGWHGKVMDDRNLLVDFRQRWFNSRLGFFTKPDGMGMLPSGSAYIFAWHDPITLSDPWGLGDDDIDWWEATKSFATTVGIGIAIIGGAALAVGAGIISAPFVIVGGLVVLAGAAVAHGISRHADGNTLGQAAVGGVLDTVGVSQIAQGGWSYDIATGRQLQMTGQQRGQALGGGLGLVTTFLIGGRVFKPMYARGVRWRQARMQSEPMVIKAKGNPDDVVWSERETYVGKERLTLYNEPTPAGRPQTLADAMDALTARLHSYSRPGVPFREAAVVRFSSLGRDGRYRGSDLVFMSRHGAGSEAGIDNAVTDAAYSWLNPRQLARYPQVKLAQIMHTHPPSGSGGRHSFPGHSSGPYFQTHGQAAMRDPLYVGEDLLGLELHMNQGPWAGRHAPTLQPFVVRIAENGAIEEFAYIIPRPMAPRHDFRFWVPDPIADGLPSLLLPNIRGH